LQRQGNPVINFALHYLVQDSPAAESIDCAEQNEVPPVYTHHGPSWAK